MKKYRVVTEQNNVEYVNADRFNQTVPFNAEAHSTARFWVKVTFVVDGADKYAATPAAMDLNRLVPDWLKHRGYPLHSFTTEVIDNP